MGSPWLLAVMGATGGGKSWVAEQIADQTGAQLINADAFQVYRGMDIGTAKPAHKSRYLMLDLCNPDYSFGVGEWAKQVSTILENLWESQRSAIVVGGTGLYIRSLFEQYEGMHGEPSPDLRAGLMDEEKEHGPEHMLRKLESLNQDAFASVDQANPLRIRRALEKVLDPRPLAPLTLPPFRKVKTSLHLPTPVLEVQLEERIDWMWQAGWAKEVETLFAQGFSVDSPGFRAIGYHQVSDFVEKSLGEEEAKTIIFSLTRRYAKRQRTWLRGEPRLRSFELLDASETSRSVVVKNVLDLLTRSNSD